MKFDEKTGKPIPENRSDEVNLTMERLNEIRKNTNGMNDKQIEICNLLADISVSLGLAVDMLGVLLNKMINKTGKGEKENDERATETTGSVE